MISQLVGAVLENCPRQVFRFESFQLPTFPLGFETRVRGILERRTYNVILVWSFPGRGLCSPEYALMINGVNQGAYYHGNGGCQTVDIVCIAFVPMQILGATENRVCISYETSVPIPKVIRQTEHRWGLSTSVYRATLCLPVIGQDPKLVSLCLKFPSGRNMTVIVLLSLSSQSRRNEETAVTRQRGWMTF